MGINAIIRETIHQKDSMSLFKHLFWISRKTDHIIGSLDNYYEYDTNSQIKKYFIKPKMPKNLVYD